MCIYIYTPDWMQQSYMQTYAQIYFCICKLYVCVNLHTHIYIIIDTSLYIDLFALIYAQTHGAAPTLVVQRVCENMLQPQAAVAIEAGCCHFPKGKVQQKQRILSYPMSARAKT